MSTTIQSISNEFTTPIVNFYASASGAITGYVMPIAWVILALGLLVWCYAIMVGKVQTPVMEWFTKLIYALLLLYAMSGAYLSWVANPLFTLGDNLSSAVSTATGGGGGTALNTMGNLFDSSVDVITSVFEAGTTAVEKLLFGTAVQLYLWGALITVILFVLLGLVLVFYIFAKIGLSLVLAVGPFFLFGLISQHTRNYFYSWLNTALYFVFYQLMIVLFVQLFLGILGHYISDLQTAIGGASFSIIDGALNLIGLGNTAFNVTAILAPIVIISVVMFFTLLQLPTLVSSMTSGSGGGFGNGMHTIRSFMGGGRGGGGGKGGGGNVKPTTLSAPKN